MSEPTLIKSYEHPIEKGGKYEPEAGRYVLYASCGCPFASRALIAHGLAELEDVIPVVNVHPVFGVVDKETDQRSWVFGGHPENGQSPLCAKVLAEATEEEKQQDTDLAWYCEVTDLQKTNVAGIDVTDKYMNAKSLKELYDLDNANCNTKYTERFTVPTLWDMKTKTIVSNESPHIMKLFDTAFNDLSPQKLKTNGKSFLNPDNIPEDEFNQLLTSLNPVLVFKPFQVAFSKDYKTYITNVKVLFKQLDKMEETLGKQRFLLGNTFTEYDIRSVVVLYRFDISMNKTWGCSYKSIHKDYPNIYDYLCDVYQNVFTTQALKDSTHPIHVLLLTYCSKAEMVPTAIIPFMTIPEFTKPVQRKFE